MLALMSLKFTPQKDKFEHKHDLQNKKKEN